VADTNLVGGSPWDEPLDEVKETKKEQPTVVGDLDFVNEAPEEKKTQTEKPLNLPTDTEEKVGTKIPVAKIMPPAGQPVKVTEPTKTSEPIPAAVKEPTKKADFWSEVYQSPAPTRTAVDSMSAKTPESIPATKPQIAIQPQVAQSAGLKGNQEYLYQPVPAVNKPTGQPTPPSVASAPAKPVPTASPATPPTPAAPVARIAPTAPPAPKKRKAKAVIFAIIIGVILLFAGGSFLTEEGIISLGLEKIYGLVRLESLWRGLPENPENAFIIAASKMKTQTSYKISGTVTMTVNRGVKSEIITPIVSAAALPIISLKDEDVGSKILATLTATQSSQSSATTTPTTSSAASTTATVEEVSGTINAKVDPNIIGAKIDLKSKKDPLSQIELVYSNKKLYLKTSETIVYDRVAKGSWSVIDFSKANSENPTEKFWSGGFSGSNFSITGTRVGNEKIDGTRCYHYQGKVNLGDALSSFGLKENTAQDINFDSWIGVKDHLLHKLELKIIPNTSAAISRLDLKLNFSDFGSDIGGFSVPASSIPYSGISATAGGSTSQPTPSQTTSTVADRDSQRKNDLANIAKSLEQYKTAHSQYPKSGGSEKISASFGTLYSALVPTYLSKIPLDPDDPKYYYGYESGGSQYTLSAVLEDIADSDGQKVGSKNIYYLKSQ